MIILGKYDELTPGMGFPSIIPHLNKEPYEGKETILNYLNNGRVHIVTASRFIDVFTNKRVNRELVHMNDGEYFWTSKIPYYVEKYNLRLPEDFEKHVLEQEKKRNR